MEGFDFNKLLSDTAGFFTEDTKDTKSEAPRPKTTLEHKDSQKAVHGSARGKPDEVAKLLLQERKRYNKLKEELVLKEKELAEANNTIRQLRRVVAKPTVKLSEHESMQKSFEFNIKLKDEIIETLARENEKLKDLQKVLASSNSPILPYREENQEKTEEQKEDTTVPSVTEPEENSDEGWLVLDASSHSKESSLQKQPPPQLLQQQLQQEQQLKQKKQQYLRKIQALREQTASLQQEKATLQKELSNANEFKQHLATQLVVMTEEKDRIQEKVNSLKKDLHSLVQRHENDKRVIIKQRAKLKEGVCEENTKLTEQFETANTANDRLQRDNKALEEALQTLSLQIEELTYQINSHNFGAIGSEARASALKNKKIQTKFQLDESEYVINRYTFAGGFIYVCNSYICVEQALYPNDKVLITDIVSINMTSTGGFIKIPTIEFRLMDGIVKSYGGILTNHQQELCETILTRCQNLNHQLSLYSMGNRVNT